MDTKKKPRLLDLNFLNLSQDLVHSLVSTVLWGKETPLPEINLIVITDWFQSQKESHPKGKYGVLHYKTDISTNSIRLYQALFDPQWKCLVARHITSDQIDVKVNQLFEGEDLVIFDPTKESKSGKPKGKGTNSKEAK